MRDPVRCTLAIAGVVLHQDAHLLSRTLIKADDMEAWPNPTNVVQGPHAILCRFDAVDGGNMPEGFHDSLAALGMSYAWAWEKGMEYEAGVEIWSHRHQRLVSAATLHGTPALTVDQLDQPDKVEEARTAKAWYDALRRQGLVYVDSAHALMAAFGDDAEGLLHWQASLQKRQAWHASIAA